MKAIMLFFLILVSNNLFADRAPSNEELFEMKNSLKTGEKIEKEVLIGRNVYEKLQIEKVESGNIDLTIGDLNFVMEDSSIVAYVDFVDLNSDGFLDVIFRYTKGTEKIPNVIVYRYQPYEKKFTTYFSTNDK